MLLELQPEFDDILQPLGNHAIEFFLAASLYHAKKVSFAKAAHVRQRGKRQETRDNLPSTVPESKTACRGLHRSSPAEPIFWWRF